MALTNTAQHYGSITKSFHWLTALLIFTLIPTGWWANQLPYDAAAELAQKAWFFSLHKTLGVSLFTVAVLRIVWAINQPKPGALNADKKAESFMAELVHWLLYAALVVVPLSGWISHAAAAGYAPIWWPFGQTLPFVPKSTSVEHAAGAVHWVATKVLITSLLLHIAGAMKHLVIDKDETLWRMLPGHIQLPELPAQHHSRAPAAGAFVVWAMVVAFGGAMGLSGDKSEAAEAPQLQAVPSDWVVQEGTIEITVVQFGNEVTGQFADWTSAITFDPDVLVGQVGTVTTTISIPSLTLGSVTDQAMGADFFDVATHPSAVFTADLIQAADGYEAVGTLQIKENSVPITLPFALALDGNSAEMRGDLILDRQNFGIGDNMADEGSLAFAVKIAIKMIAERIE